MSIDGTFGNILNGFLSAINQKIEEDINQLQNAGIEIEIEAGEQVSRAISELANNYQKELNNTIDKVSEAARQAFNQIDTLVQSFTNTIDRDFSQLMASAQQLVNTLPFANKQPQLIDITPRFIVITDKKIGTSLVTFKGNFLWANTPGFGPTLSFGNVVCPLIDSDTKKFIFSVPQSIFDAAIKGNAYNYATGTLIVPWEKKEWIVWTTKTQSTYQVALGALPLIAGSGETIFDIKGTQRDIESKAGNYKFNGNSYYPEPYKIVPLNIDADPGWTIDHDSVQVTPHREHGIFLNPTIDVSLTQIHLSVKLYCEHGHDISIMNVDVSFNQYQDKPKITQRKEPFQIGWTGSQLLTPQTNEVINSVSFTDYKGTFFAFGGPQNDDRCVLKVLAVGNGSWEIYAEPPTSLTASLENASPQLKEEIQKVIRFKELLKANNLSNHRYQRIAHPIQPIAHLQAMQLQQIAQVEVQRQLDEQTATGASTSSGSTSTQEEQSHAPQAVEAAIASSDGSGNSENVVLERAG